MFGREKFGHLSLFRWELERKEEKARERERETKEEREREFLTTLARTKRVKDP